MPLMAWSFLCRIWGWGQKQYLNIDGHELVIHQQILSNLSAISVINNDLHSVLKSSVLLWFVARQGSLDLACVEVTANGCGVLHGLQFTAVLFEYLCDWKFNDFIWEQPSCIFSSPNAGLPACWHSLLSLKMIDRLNYSVFWLLSLSEKH